MQQIGRWTVVSVLAGLVLGLFLKAVQFMTDIKVYTLLLNIDYMPVLSRWELGELGEFTLHLLVGIVIGNVLQWFIQYKELRQSYQFFVIIIASLVVAVTYYPVTILSDQTPELGSLSAFLWWMLGHLLYGMALYYFYKKIVKD